MRAGVHQDATWDEDHRRARDERLHEVLPAARRQSDFLLRGWEPVRDHTCRDEVDPDCPKSRVELIFAADAYAGPRCAPFTLNCARGGQPKADVPTLGLLFALPSLGYTSEFAELG
jgi:hypothetical protein